MTCSPRPESTRAAAVVILFILLTSGSLTGCALTDHVGWEGEPSDDENNEEWLVPEREDRPDRFERRE